MFYYTISSLKIQPRMFAKYAFQPIETTSRESNATTDQLVVGVQLFLDAYPLKAVVSLVDSLLPPSRPETSSCSNSRPTKDPAAIAMPPVRT